MERGRVKGNNTIRVFPVKARKAYMLSRGIAPLILNPLNAGLNPICPFQALLGAHRILHVSRIRVNLDARWR
jgi:hypothetical protein